MNRSIALVIVPLSIIFASPITRAATPWERYLESPTPENARKVLVVSYDSDQPDSSADEDLRLLMVQVQSTDLEAIRLAFRLLPKSDGERGEVLCITLGRVIRLNPKVFLDELKSADIPAELIGGVVGNFGPEYVDRERAQQYEAHRRISALQSVKDARLAKLRDASVKELRQMLGPDGG